MKKILLIGGGALLLLLSVVFGAFFAGPLLAQASTSGQATATPAATKTNPYCEQYLQDLANRLHVPVSTLTQQSVAAREDVINQMVKDGKLTQNQANALKKRLESGKTCTARNWGPHANVQGVVLKKYLPDLESQVAQGLNISVTQLQSDLKAGKSLNDIASAQKVSSAQLHTIVLNALNTIIAKAVKAGDLTQAQANTYQQFLQKHPQALDRLLSMHFGKHALKAAQGS